MEATEKAERAELVAVAVQEGRRLLLAHYSRAETRPPIPSRAPRILVRAGASSVR